VSTRSNHSLHRSQRRGRARTVAASLLALACLTSALTAQGRKRGAAPDDPSAAPRPALNPVLWEPEQIFPLAIEHAVDLKLTDEQRTKIETINSQLKASNAPLMIAIDTLRPAPIRLPEPGATSEPSVTPPPPTPEQIAAVVARRHALGEARAQVHENIRLARDQMTALMTPEQQQRLEALETSARNSAERGDPGGSSGQHGGGGGGHGGHRGGGQGPP
jgi:hypothetical protein